MNQDERPTSDFDHHSASYAADPTQILGEMRGRCPLTWTPSHGGYWVATAWESVHEIARDAAVFSSARSGFGGEGLSLTIPKNPSRVVIVPEELDPPAFFDYRHVLNRLLAPSAVAAMAPTVDRWVSHYLDQMTGHGEWDLVSEFTEPVPASVTLEWLGFPPGDWRFFADPFHDIVGYSPGAPEFQAAARGLDGVVTRINDVVNERREEPRDDTISSIVATRINGEAIGHDECVSMIYLLLAGGIDTTTSATTSTLVYLSRNPPDRARLIEDPPLLDVAVEEFLRAFPPAKNHARTVTTDTEMSGCQLARGDRVLLSWLGANYDPVAFEDPHRVVLDRFPNRHASFGLGIHRCAGSHLARSMFKAMVRAVLDRLPEYEVIEEGVVAYPSVSIVGGYTTVPIRTTPRTPPAMPVD